MRGFYGVGIYHPKTSMNVGTLWRTANLLDAAFIFTIGPRYKKQASDTMKTSRHIPLYNYANIQDLIDHLPDSCPLVAVELDKRAVNLKDFQHPERACYLLGAEDHGLPQPVLDKCHHLIKLDGEFSMNVAVAGSIVLYHRTSL